MSEMQRGRTKMMALPALAGTARVQSCGNGTFPSLWAERHSSGKGMFDYANLAHSSRG